MIGLAFLAASGPQPPVAVAENAPPDSASARAPEWQFEFTPYLWLIGIDGTVSVGRQEGDFTASFSDLFARLRLALMGVLEARRGRWGLIADGMYFDLGETAAGPGPGGGTMTAGITAQLYSVGGVRRILDGRDTALDLLVGARYTDIAVYLAVDGGPLDGESESRSRDWVDAIAGGRVAYRIAERWKATAYVEGGAGGSDFTWQAMVGADFQVTRSLTARGEYRYLSIDNGSRQVDYDLSMGGPILGLGILF